MSKRILLLVAVAVAIAGFIAWKVLAGPDLPEGIAAGNGRLEANELFVSAKIPGRIKEVLVNEGDTVVPGQVVARLDTEELEASLRQAEAQIAQARDTERAAAADIGTKRAQVNVRRAQIEAKQADFSYASQQLSRSRGLVPTGAVSQQEMQLDSAQMLSSRAQVASSRADLAAAQADLAQAQAMAGRTSSTIQAAAAEADRIRAQIKDAVLVAPIRGRIERRLAEQGEVVGAGGRVYSLVDLSDVYMYIFLPEKVTGKLRLGSEARIVLDSAPQYPIRAVVSYISPTAQFTPKTVETAEERHNLTFRVKLQIPRERLQQYEALVKAGVPGMGYVRFNDGTQWPAKLQPPAKIPSNLFAPAGPAKGN
jgi:HlyD family secretion protein